MRIFPIESPVTMNSLWVATDLIGWFWVRFSSMSPDLRSHIRSVQSFECVITRSDSWGWSPQMASLWPRKECNGSNLSGASYRMDFNDLLESTSIMTERFRWHLIAIIELPLLIVFGNVETYLSVSDSKIRKVESDPAHITRSPTMAMASPQDIFRSTHFSSTRSSPRKTSRPEAVMAYTWSSWQHISLKTQSLCSPRIACFDVRACTAFSSEKWSSTNQYFKWRAPAVTKKLPLEEKQTDEIWRIRSSQGTLNSPWRWTDLLQPSSQTSIPKELLVRHVGNRQKLEICHREKIWLPGRRICEKRWTKRDPLLLYPR